MLSRAIVGALVVALGAASCVEGPRGESESIGSAASALTIDGLFATGVNAAGAPLANGATDPHYTLSSNDPALPGPNALAIAPAGGWTGNTATSKWISAQANAQAVNNGVYAYTTTFSLAGVSPATATITGRWTCDDVCTVRLNGTQVAANNGPNAWTTVANFTIPAGSPFQLGTNTLVFQATNSGGQVSGLQVVALSGTVNGCATDDQCTTAQFCNTQTATCVPKLVNGTPVPTVAGHTPALNGTCSPAVGSAVCVSGVCDTNDKSCGFANGDGPCSVASAPTVCRSGACSTNGLCKPADGCNVDADCTDGRWCNESTHTCTTKFANGSAMPTDPAHVTPVLNGQCAAAAATLVCLSGVCDTDNRCGFADGGGPCSTTNASIVCRSGACSSNNLCEPAGGCNVDGDCTGGNWCDESTHTCTPKLANGAAMPSDPPHVGPVLNGTCTKESGALVCQSGVCDKNDNRCGYAYGDGPCTVANGATVCRLGLCSANASVCVPTGGCAVDGDCSAVQWCDIPSFTCVAKIVNGQPVPKSAGHTPTLDGTCTTMAGAAVCVSAVCDTKDNDCGFANGDGPCTATNGATVCRSTVCATSGANQGLCVACVMDAQCSGATPACNASANTCVTCTASNDMACTAATPICDVASSTCVVCDGDLGGGTKDACNKANAPFCFLSGASKGQCGKCASDADCVGHASGNGCDTTTGTCVSVCHTDADCTSDQWCNAPAGGSGMCAAKLVNGTPLPSAPTEVSTCSDAVGKRVCVSGVCDSTDQKCGFANGDGPCTDATVCRSGACDSKDGNCGYPNGEGPCTDGMVCRSGACNSKDGNCGLPTGEGPCTTDAVCRDDRCDTKNMVCGTPPTLCTKDADCPDTDFCKSDGMCTPKLPGGSVCDRGPECLSGNCANAVCTAVVASGNGLVCATREGGTSGSEGGVGVVGLVLAAAGLARRKRRSA